jgi:hypothetical protein
MNEKNLWEEEAIIVVYVQHRSPHHLKKMTLEESLSRNNPSVENLRVFGCHSRRKNGRKP